jgi:hypothetical protein
MGASDGVAALSRARVVQNAYLVEDLEASCRRLHRLLGIGPFLGGGVLRLTDHRYRGHPAEPVELRAVFAQSGDLVIELIQLLSTGPSAFRDMYAPGEEGLHHVAIIAGDYEAERDALVGLGYPIASEFRTSAGVSVAFADTRAELGHMLELYPDHPTVCEPYARTRAAAEAWDGEFAIRDFG